MRDLPEDEFRKIVGESHTVTEALRKMGYMYTSGTAPTTFRKICKERNIDISHFCHGSSEVRKLKKDEIFIKDSKVSQSSLREYYLKGNYSEYKCAICGISEWNGKPLTLRLDHINGYNKDDRLENLRWVCPNCDSQLPTFCSGHKGIFKPRYFCVDCGIEIKSGNKRCKKCNQIFNKEKWKNLTKEAPPRDILKKDVYENRFKELECKYNVCSKTIAKWCKEYEFPTWNALNIKMYTKEEWENEVPLSDVLNRVENQKKNKGEKSSPIPVEKIDIDTGEVVTVYESISMAARESGTNKSNIQSALKSKSHKCKGFLWKLYKPE